MMGGAGNGPAPFLPLFRRVKTGELKFHWVIFNRTD
jgi:hypothetical protein